MDSEVIRAIAEEAKKERERIMKVIEERRTTTPPMDSAEELHVQLTLTVLPSRSRKLSACP